MVFANGASAKEAADENPEASEEAAANVDADSSINSVYPITLTEPSSRDRNDNHLRDEDENPNNYLIWGDGIAQWIMAFFGIVATGISGWAVWLLKKTLDATREAVEETGEATKAMIRQNELTEYAQRPWIVVDGLKIVDGGDIDVCFRNIGHSPARQFIKTADACLLPKPFAASPIPDFEFSNHTFLAPNATEFMRIAGAPKPKEGYDVLIRIRLSYVLPNNTCDHHFEYFTIDLNGSICKSTAEDFKRN